MTAVSLLVLSLWAADPTGDTSAWASFPSGDTASAPVEAAPPAEPAAPVPAEGTSSPVQAEAAPAASEGAPLNPGPTATATVTEEAAAPAPTAKPVPASVSRGTRPARTRTASARTSTRAPASAATAGAQPGGLAPVAAPEPLPGISGTPVRVENRILVKERKFFATGGLSYLFRGDYYVSPAISGTASFFLDEGHGLEAKLDVFVSFLAPGASEIFNALGLIPDAHRPVARLSAGYRNAMAYGKVMAFGAFLLHFDLHAAAHLGFLFTDRQVAPSLSLGPGFLVRLNPTLYLQFDLPVFVSFESRQSGLVSVGVMPAITLGIRP